MWTVFTREFSVSYQGMSGSKLYCRISMFSAIVKPSALHWYGEGFADWGRATLHSVFWLPWASDGAATVGPLGRQNRRQHRDHPKTIQGLHPEPSKHLSIDTQQTLVFNTVRVDPKEISLFFKQVPCNEARMSCKIIVLPHTSTDRATGKDITWPRFTNLQSLHVGARHQAHSCNGLVQHLLMRFQVFAWIIWLAGFQGV